MNEHLTWFAFLPNYDRLVRIFESWTGPSWFFKSHLDLQHVLGAVALCILLIVVASILKISAPDEEKLIVPEGKPTIRNFLEVITEIVLNFMEEIMGRKAARYFFPLIGTCAFFIFFSNFMGFIPGLAPPTNNLNTTAACAMIIFISTHIFGVKQHGAKYLLEFLGPIRKWYALPLMIFMFVVEVIGHVARPVSLSVRLMGNMFADHLAVGIVLALFPLFAPLPLMFLGIIVCIVQTLVFILLSMVYIGTAISHEH